MARPSPSTKVSVVSRQDEPPAQDGQEKANEVCHINVVPSNASSVVKREPVEQEPPPSPFPCSYCPHSGQSLVESAEHLLKSHLRKKLENMLRSMTDVFDNLDSKDGNNFKCFFYRCSYAAVEKEAFLHHVGVQHEMVFHAQMKIDDPLETVANVVEEATDQEEVEENE